MLPGETLGIYGYTSAVTAARALRVILQGKGQYYLR